MAVDQDIETFTLDLFNRLWLENGYIYEPLTLQDPVKPKYSVPIEDIYEAVRVQQRVFRKSYEKLFRIEDSLDASVTDFYAYLEENCPHSELEHLSTMEKVLSACTFVAEMCKYAIYHKNYEFVDSSYLICAMYIEQEFKSDFYSEGGWWSLIKTCQSYKAVFMFLCRHIVSCKASDCKRSIDSYERFLEVCPVKEDPDLYPFLTLLWVDDCIQNLKESSSQSKNTTPEILHINEAGRVLDRLKFYCDPSGNAVKLYDGVIDFAVRCGREPLELLSAYVHCRPFDRVVGSPQPKPEIFALEQRVKNLIKPDSSPENENQGWDDRKYDEVLELFFELHEKKNKNVVRRFGKEKAVNEISKPIPCSLNDPQVLLRSLDDGTTNFTRSDSAKARSVGNKNFPSNVQTSKEVSSSKLVFKYKKDKDQITNLHSQINLSSTKSVENSPNHSQSSDDMNKRSGGKENSPNTQTSDKTYSLKTFNESSDTSESLKDKKDKDQITGLLSQQDLNLLSPDGLPFHSQIYGVKKRRPGEKEISPSNVQISRSPSHERILRESHSTMKTSESKKDEAFDVITNLTYFRDDANISPKHSRSTDTIRKGSVEKEIYLGFQRTEDELLRRNKLLKSPNTGIQKHKDQITNDPNFTFTANPQDQTSSTSTPSKMEKEKLTGDDSVSFSDVSSIHSPVSPNVYSPESPNVYSPESPNVYSPESPNVYSPKNLLNTVSQVTDESDHNDLTTINKDSVQFLDASNTVSRKKDSDPKIVTEDHQNTSCTDVDSRCSSDTVSVEESDELDEVDFPKPTRSTTSPPNPSRTRLPNVTSASVEKKKSKSSPESAPTRRKQLLETEEHIKDILRMIHVLGDTTSLEFMKSTLKSNKKST